MDNLITALQLMQSKISKNRSFDIWHDLHYFHVHGVDVTDVTEEEVAKLDELGFFWVDRCNEFLSCKYGSY